MEYLIGGLMVLVAVGLPALVLWLSRRDVPRLVFDYSQTEIINGQEVLTFWFTSGQKASFSVEGLHALIGEPEPTEMTDAVSSRTIGFAPWDEEGDD